MTKKEARAKLWKAHEKLDQIIEDLWQLRGGDDEEEPNIENHLTGVGNARFRELVRAVENTQTGFSILDSYAENWVGWERE